MRSCSCTTHLSLDVAAWMLIPALVASQPAPAPALPMARGCKCSPPMPCLPPIPLKNRLRCTAGVIVESEEIHRLAYNASFANFEVVCPGETSPVVWSEEYYDQLQNQVGAP